MASFALNRKVFLPINNVFELGRRGVRKELVALRGKDGGDVNENASPFSFWVDSISRLISYV